MIGITQIKRFMTYLFSQDELQKSSEAKAPKQHLWSIGIYTGRSPFSFEPAPNINNPVLTYEDVSDVSALMVADPFMINVHGTWHMFFEVFNRTGKGEIGCAVSQNGFEWRYQRIVLAEPFHLSYPYVFEWMGEYYMIPESHQVKDVRLYKARQFPDSWECIGTLLSGQQCSDSSIFRHGEHWWLFTETNLDKFDTLRLYSATTLMGPWREHPRSPIIYGNPHIARPAGRVVVVQDRIIRYTQDCYPIYGTSVWPFEITELTALTYQERQVSKDTFLGPSGIGWNTGGMHHIDPHQLSDGQWIACVDGWVGVDSLLTNVTWRPTC